MEPFYFEMTDTYGGDLNYCWLQRYTVYANNLKGALMKMSKATGYHFRFNGSYYKVKGACIALYALEYELYDDDDWFQRSTKIGEIQS